MVAAIFMVFTAICTSAITDPYVIIDKYIAAIGGWDKLEAQKSIHAAGKIVLEGTGLDGTIETWQQEPDKSRQEFDIKVLKQVSGDNGQFAWRVDQNGKLQIMRDEASLKERRLGILISKREQLKRGAKEFTVAYDRIDTADGKTCYVIKTTNTINSFVTYDYYDTTNFLPIKNVTIKPDGEAHVINEDFRPVEGVLTPFVIKTLELPTEQRATITLSSVEINQPLDSMLFEPPSEQKKDYRFPAGITKVEVPFKFIELHLYVPLTINGKTKLWVLDSGAGSSVIEKEFAEELGLPQQGKLVGQGATNTAEFSFSVLPPFDLNGIAFDSQKVAVFPLNELMRKTSETEIGGILGYDFLSRLVTKVDYAHETLTFFEPDSFVYNGDGVVLDAPLTKDNMLQLSITVDDKYSGLWDLDLGASGMDFFYAYAEANGFLNRKGIEKMGFGAGGGAETKSVQFKSVTLAGFTKKDPIIDISLTKGKGAFANTELTGNAGNTLFRHFTLYLDYKREKVIVEKGADFDKVFPRDNSGLQILSGTDGQLEVIMVADGTPGAKAGIKKGDKVISIDGKTVKEIGGLLAVRDKLRGPVGTKYKIELARDNKPEIVSLTLKDLYD